MIRTPPHLPAAALVGLATLSGCREPGADGSGFTVATTTAEAVPTVVEVDWKADFDGIESARVEFGPTLAYGRVASVELSFEGGHHVELLGSKPETDVHLRIVAQTADGTVRSEDHVITTGPVPAALPDFDVEGRATWDGFLVTGLVTAPPTPCILDADGDYVWWQSTGDDHDSDDTLPPGTPAAIGVVMLGRVALALDGSGMRYTNTNVLGGEANGIYRISPDGVTTDHVDTPYGNHDFVELPDGTFAYLAYSPLGGSRDDFGANEVMGAKVVELAPDGTSRDVYTIWDYYDYDDSGDDDASGATWPHANAIDYVPELDAYLVSFLSLDTIVAIDRESGVPLWNLGGPQSDFTLNGGSTELFDTEHQFEWLGDSILVFVNGGMDIGARSRALEYALDFDTMTATEVWSYWPHPDINNANFGDVRRLDSGNTLVTFSVAGEVHEVDPDGEVAWRLVGDVGSALGYATLVPDLDLGAMAAGN